MFLCVKCFDSTVSAAFNAFIKVLESFLTVDPSAGYYIKKRVNIIKKSELYQMYQI